MYESIYARNVVNPVEEQGRLDVDAERKAAASAMQTAFSPGLGYAKDMICLTTFRRFSWWSHSSFFLPSNQITAAENSPTAAAVERSLNLVNWQLHAASWFLVRMIRQNVSAKKPCGNIKRGQNTSNSANVITDVIPLNTTKRKMTASMTLRGIRETDGNQILWYVRH